MNCKRAALVWLPMTLYTGQLFAGGGAAGNNSTHAGNYTVLATQLSALRLADQGNRSGDSLPGRPGRVRPKSLFKKDNVVYGKKGRHTRSARPAPPLNLQQHHGSHLAPSRSLPARSSTACGRLLKVRPSTVQQPAGSQAVNHPQSDNNSDCPPQALYRHNHRGYALETRRQRKRRMAREGDLTPLYAANLTNISANCSGHYRLAESIDVGASGAKLPLCNRTSFRGTLRGNGHTLRNITGEHPLFYRLENAQIKIRLEKSRYSSSDHLYFRSTGLLTRVLEGRNRLSLSGSLTELHSQSYYVGSMGEINLGGGHHLEQSAFHSSMSGNGVGGGSAVVSLKTNTTLIQTDCTFEVVNLKAGGGGIGTLIYTKQRPLVLTQTDVTIRETERHPTTFYIGGGVGMIIESYAVLTQTAVNISLHNNSVAPSENKRDEGAAFARTLLGSTVTLRLFSGTGNTEACGFIEPENSTLKGVIDVAGYTPDATSCQKGNHTGLKLLDTTQADLWREAHEEFCCSKAEGIARISCPSSHNTDSCHYPHEQLLATVGLGNNSILLLSRQRYPYNDSSAERGLLRLSRLHLSLESSSKPHSCLLYTSPSPRDRQKSRMPSSA